jgi:transposase
MLDAAERMEISVLSEHGGSIRSIARATGRSRNTVRRYLRCGDDGPAGRCFTSAADLMLAKAQRQNRLKDFVHCTSLFRRGDAGRAELAEAIRFGATARPSPA